MKTWAELLKDQMRAQGLTPIREFLEDEMLARNGKMTREEISEFIRTHRHDRSPKQIQEAIESFRAQWPSSPTSFEFTEAELEKWNSLCTSQQHASDRNHDLTCRLGHVMLRMSPTTTKDELVKLIEEFS